MTRDRVAANGTNVSPMSLDWIVQLPPVSTSVTYAMRCTGASLASTAPDSLVGKLLAICQDGTWQLSKPGILHLVIQ